MFDSLKKLIKGENEPIQITAKEGIVELSLVSSGAEETMGSLFLMLIIIIPYYILMLLWAIRRVDIGYYTFALIALESFGFTIYYNHIRNELEGTDILFSVSYLGQDSYYEQLLIPEPPRLLVVPEVPIDTSEQLTPEEIADIKDSYGLAWRLNVPAQEGKKKKEKEKEEKINGLEEGNKEEESDRDLGRGASGGEEAPGGGEGEDNEYNAGSSEEY